jgi:hypothetical protein
MLTSIASATLRCGCEPLKNSLVQWVRETHSADVSINPANAAFKRFETVELDPDSFADRRSLNELYFAAFRRSIEDAYSKAVQSCTSNSDFGLESVPPRVSFSVMHQ